MGKFVVWIIEREIFFWLKIVGGGKEFFCLLIFGDIIWFFWFLILLVLKLKIIVEGWVIFFWVEVGVILELGLKIVELLDKLIWVFGVKKIIVIV